MATRAFAVLCLAVLISCSQGFREPSPQPPPTSEAIVIESGGVQSVTLRALANNRFVCAEDGGRSPLIANREAAGTWETFGLIPQGGTTVAFVAQVNGAFVCAENGGTRALIANRWEAKAWECFDLVPLGGDHYALRSKANGKFVCAENAGSSSLIANRDAASIWETFVIRPVGASLDAPANLQAVAGDAGANLRWDAVPGATSYTVDYATSSFQGSLVVANNACALRDLVNGKTYTASVTATNGTLSSTPSEAVSFTPQASSYLAAPTGVVAIPGAGLATVTWDSVEGATGYTLTCTSEGITRDVVGASSPYLMNGIQDGKTYTVTLTAANDALVSPPSDPVSFRHLPVSDLDALFRSRPSDAERDQILQMFHITLVDGPTDLGKWSQCDPYRFDPTGTLPSVYPLVNSLRVIREQTFTEPLPWTRNLYAYLLDHFTKGGIELRLDNGFNYGGGHHISLNANATFWDGRTSADPFTPFPNFQIFPWKYRTPLIVHETRHCDADDPGHSPVEGGKDQRFAENGAYVYDTIYKMWIYKYGLNTAAVDRAGLGSEAGAELLSRFVEQPPTHVDPKVQALIDELMP